MKRIAAWLVLAAGLAVALASGPVQAAPETAPGVFDPAAPGQLRLRSFALVNVPPPLASQAPKKPFRLYYSFTFANQPEGLDRCGLTRLPLLTPGYFFKGGKVLDRIDRAYVDQRLPIIRQALADAGGDIGILNIEGPWTIKRTDPQGTVAAKIDSHLDLIAYLKSRLGDQAKFGVYGEAPLKDFFSYQTDYFGNPGDPMYGEFIQAPSLAAPVNRQISRLALASDALFPPYYVFWYDDMGTTAAQRRQLTVQSWTSMAQQSLKVAQQWNKPVYPFIWMQFHNKINVPDYASTFLHPGFFRYQLDTLKKLGADGVVIWGTLGETNGRAVFDKNADWWKEYLAFAKENGAELRKCPHLPG
ncbi:hypothetical protein [Geminicoccus roseus]|uniref:hypothetical protein n=1 Tax=Geminicoccus roseus TaxID=404900 RepID=UPI000410450C|nr:hypothetical protein [Geminicoccus roseus]